MVKYIPGSVYQVGRLLIDGLICVHMGAAQPELEFQTEKASASPKTLYFKGCNVFFSLTLAN